MINEKVFDIIASNLNVPIKTLTMKTDLVSELDADSIDTANILNSIKGQLGVDINMEEALSLETIGDVIELINRKSRHNH